MQTKFNRERCAGSRASGKNKRYAANRYGTFRFEKVFLLTQQSHKSDEQLLFGGEIPRIWKLNALN